MTRRFLSAAAAALLLASPFHTASADVIDASTLTCRDLVAKAASSDKKEEYGASVILYWVAGYLATVEQGTVVDFDNLGTEFGQTIEFCGDNPDIGVMTAAQKYMGENAEDATSKAIDLAILKCEGVMNSDVEDADGLGQILMWLAGYHASYAESKVIDTDKFKKSIEKIANYCAENPQMGLFTTSEKFMGGDGE
ncbi:HdeA/HdeB family chaperone [Hyphomicrobium sp.]|uniref:HdeA/HdeB family chaperone n=1 Tax=Hyphomicrobium sp. TaxID=82 RepID=UPI002D765F3C|nr:HdeA/HdeB family chaperone [Hyphomicrobium sp.]HET6390180.1 HdeA/HdeB family chaperone [Hyphomicrobium sp.]